MDKAELILFKRLLDATLAGECPAPNCPICKEKGDAILDAKEFIVTEDEK